MTPIPAVFEALSTDEPLAALLGEYLDAPCAFAETLVPEDAPRPYVWISPLMKNTRWGGKIEHGRQTRLEVWCAADNNGSTMTIDAIAERVAYVLEHLDSIIDSATDLIIAEIEGPVGMETDESIIGRKFTLRFTTM